MNKLLNFNLYLILSVILVGILFSLPHFFGLLLIGKNYLALSSTSPLTYIREETYSYAAQVQHLLNGYLLGDPYIWEYRNSPSPFLGELGSIIPTVALSKITGSVPWGFFFSDLLFPPVLFLIIFYGLYKLGLDKFFSATASLGILIIPFLSTLFPRISSYGTLLTGAADSLLFFSRTPHPQISAIFLFLSLFMTVLVIKTPAKRRLVYLWVVTLGLSIYSSPYVMSTIFLAMIILAPVFFKKIPKTLLLEALIIIVVFSLPWLINSLTLKNILNNSGFIERFSFPIQFLFPVQIRYALIAIFLTIVGKKDIVSKVILAYIISGAILIDLHQIFIGRDIQADHWISRVLAPLATLGLFLIIERLVNFYQFQFKKVLWISIATIIILIGFNNNLRWISNHSNKFGGNLYQDILSEIEAKLEKSAVIGTLNSSLNEEIRAKTGRWVYTSPGDRSFISGDEATQRICNLSLMTGNWQNAEGLLLYFLALESKNQYKVEIAKNQLFQCLAKSQYKPKYKIDYIIVFDQRSGDWQIKTTGQ